MPTRAADLEIIYWNPTRDSPTSYYTFASITACTYTLAKIFQIVPLLMISFQICGVELRLEGSSQEFMSLGFELFGGPDL